MDELIVSVCLNVGVGNDILVGNVLVDEYVKYWECDRCDYRTNKKSSFCPKCNMLTMNVQWENADYLEDDEDVFG